jgi:hypothetical protein
MPGPNDTYYVSFPLRFAKFSAADWNVAALERSGNVVNRGDAFAVFKQARLPPPR